MRDYSVQCPEGFIEEGSNCIATTSYKGPCAQQQPELHILSAAAKAVWGFACKAAFPCMQEHCPNGVDYTQPCPIGFVLEADKTCSAAAPASANSTTAAAAAAAAARECAGPLAAAVAAGDSIAKARLEGMCGLRWPCKKKICIKDFSSDCPTGWVQKQHNSGVCTAPPTYKGPCEKELNLKEYKGSSSLKRALEKRCNVSWTCSSSSSSSSSSREKLRDFSSPCPLSWVLQEDGSCRGPPTYTATDKCSSNIFLKDKTLEEKEIIASACNLYFPFAGKIKQI